MTAIHFYLQFRMARIHFYLRVPMTTMHFYLRAPMTTIDSICYSFIHPHDRSPLRTRSKHLCICLLVSPVGDLSLPSSLARWTVFYHRIRTKTASHDSSAKKQCCEQSILPASNDRTAHPSTLHPSVIPSRRPCRRHYTTVMPI